MSYVSRVIQDVSLAVDVQKILETLIPAAIVKF